MLGYFLNHLELFFLLSFVHPIAQQCRLTIFWNHYRTQTLAATNFSGSRNTCPGESVHLARLRRFARFIREISGRTCIRQLLYYQDCLSVSSSWWSHNLSQACRWCGHFRVWTSLFRNTANTRNYYNSTAYISFSQTQLISYPHSNLKPRNLSRSTY